MNMKLTGTIAGFATMFFISILMCAGVSCSNDKTAQIKEEIAAAYAAASENLDNAHSTADAERVSGQLQETLDGINRKYKDVYETMSRKELTSLQNFCKEQRNDLYDKASGNGKMLIDGISSATYDAFGATVGINEVVISVNDDASEN